MIKYSNIFQYIINIKILNYYSLEPIGGGDSQKGPNAPFHRSALTAS